MPIKITSDKSIKIIGGVQINIIMMLFYFLHMLDEIDN